VIIVHERPRTEKWRAFAEHVAGLLGVNARFQKAPSGLPGEDAGRRMGADVSGDVVVIEVPRPTWVKRVLGRAPAHALATRSGTTVLVAREPRWPFDRLLLVLRDTPADEPAIRWALRLAAAGATEVTILPVVPSLPALYAQGSRGQPDLEVLLEPSTPTGRMIDQVVRALLKVGVPEVAVHQQRGAPVWQICQEIAVTDCDLVVIGAESGSRLYRWFSGELLPPLLRRCPIPLLVARGAGGRAGAGYE
jgi:nucleotide-binding universal stress UspA family protein